jgi:hypothetical protein
MAARMNRLALVARVLVVVFAFALVHCSSSATGTTTGTNTGVNTSGCEPAVGVTAAHGNSATCVGITMTFPFVFNDTFDNAIRALDKEIVDLENSDSTFETGSTAPTTDSTCGVQLDSQFTTQNSGDGVSTLTLAFAADQSASGTFQVAIGTTPTSHTATTCNYSLTLTPN